MIGRIIHINKETGNFSISTKNGLCTICNTSEIEEIKIGDDIDFDNSLGGSYFRNLRTERFSARIVYWNIKIVNSVDYCK